MKGIIRPFAVLPEVLSGKEGFSSFNEWKTFIREALERMERGAVMIDYGLQNAVSKSGGFIQANTVLKHLLKKNLLYRWPKQAPDESSHENIFRSLLPCPPNEVITGIISVHQNTTGHSPESTHPLKLSNLDINDNEMNLKTGWWWDLMKQEIQFEKTPQNYKKLLVPLAKQGGHMEIWDPYFNPKKNNYVHWQELLKEMAKNTRCTFRIHTSEKALENAQGNYMNFSFAMRPLQGAFSRGSNRLEVLLRRYKEIPKGFHDRFVFTAKSISIQFSWGIDCGNDHEQTVIVLTPETAEEKQRIFNSAPSSSVLDRIGF